MKPLGFSQGENERARKVYGALIDSKFDFLNKPMELQEIYELVKARWPEFCNDGYLCIQNCKSGGGDPEWKHSVRSAVNSMKRKGIISQNLDKTYVKCSD